MSAFDVFTTRNRAYVAGSGAPAQLPPVPRSGVFLVTCLDPRVEPAGFLGVEPGDAFVVRNAGGRLNDGTIFDIALVGALREAMGAGGPPLEVAIVHHTRCGSGFLAKEDFRRSFGARTGLPDADLMAAAVTDPYDTVRADVARLRSSPLASGRIVVSGHVLDLSTGRVETVCPAAAPD